jgi:hypothetical protein
MVVRTVLSLGAGALLLGSGSGVVSMDNQLRHTGQLDPLQTVIDSATGTATYGVAFLGISGDIKSTAMAGAAVGSLSRFATSLNQQSKRGHIDIGTLAVDTGTGAVVGGLGGAAWAGGGKLIGKL